MSRNTEEKQYRLYGDFTRQRMKQAPDGITLPTAPNEPSYVNSPIRSENAPNHAPISLLEKKLKNYEMKKIVDYIAGYLILQGKIRIADVASGTGMPKGKRSPGDYSPLTDEEMALAGRYQMISTQLSQRVKSGLELIAGMYVGSCRTKLLELGQHLARDNHRKSAEGALVNFYIGAAYDIESAERHFEIESRNQGVRPKSRFPKVGLAQ